MALMYATLLAMPLQAQEVTTLVSNTTETVNLIGHIDPEQKALHHPPALVSQPPPHGFLPRVATGLTDQDRKRIEDALDRSVSANTRTMYASARATSRQNEFSSNSHDNGFGTNVIKRPER